MWKLLWWVIHYIAILYNATNGGCKSSYKAEHRDKNNKNIYIERSENMAKFTPMYYYTSKREKKLNCYMIPVPKDVVEKAQLAGYDIQIKVEGNKIVLEKKKSWH